MTTLFDSLLPLGYSNTLLMESTAIGATAALRAWAESHGYQFVEKSITPPGCPTIFQLTVQVPNGPHIAVQRNGEVVS